MKNLVKIFFYFFIFSFAIHAATMEKKSVTIDFHQVKLEDALRILAKCFHQNIIIPMALGQPISLHLQNMTYQEIFDLLLTTNNLIKKEYAHTWLIASYAAISQQEQEQTKLAESRDAADPLITTVLQIRYAKAKDLANLLQENGNSLLSKRGQMKIDDRTNRICIQDTRKHLNEIAMIIKKLDIPVQQILIEARLASVDTDCERDLGINFDVQDTGSSLPKTSLPHYSLAIAKLADSSLLDVQLTALEREGRSELISKPSLFTANQQSAAIESGEEIPYQEMSESGGTTVAFKKAVLSLKVTPQIMPNHKILLQLQVNQDRPSNRIVQGVPAINTREINTHILVNDQQTLVLGGIYEANYDEAEQRIPFLGKIPVLGWLFKEQNLSQNKRELLIFVTPKIIS